MSRPDLPATRIAFTASDRDEAQEAKERLIKRYGEAPESEARVVVALGGDGFMLETLHRHIGDRCAIYGMNRGSVGFLMNEYSEESLLERIAQAERAVIHPLRMKARDADGDVAEALAINEVSLLRQTRQTAKLRITIDGKVRLTELQCDGAMIATPAGSTAYNLVLALTPISAFRPRRWRGALLPHKARIKFEILEAEKRPVSAVADNFEVRDVVEVEVEEDRGISLTMLFDAGRSLEERVLAEQFSV
jgi:NAD+ kinase